MRQVAARLVPSLVLLQLSIGVALAQSLEETEALALLQKIGNAARELNYTGTFVYQHDDQVETSRITHAVEGRLEYEKLETLDGPRRQIIRTDEEIVIYDAEHRVVKHERRSHRKSFPALLPEQLSHLTEYYKVRRGGQERIAGFEARALVLEPRDAFRYGHKLWAEVSTGLLLKARMLDEKGRVVEQFVFTQLVIGNSVTRDAVKTSFDTTGWRVEPLPPASGDNPGSTGWSIKGQPPGFSKIMEMKRAKIGVPAVSHLVYSDGLAAVSVFIEPLPKKFQEGFMQQGAVNIYTRPLNNQLVTVLGEVPVATVKQIADSVIPRE